MRNLSFSRVHAFHISVQISDSSHLHTLLHYSVYGWAGECPLGKWATHGDMYTPFSLLFALDNNGVYFSSHKKKWVLKDKWFDPYFLQNRQYFRLLKSHKSSWTPTYLVLGSLRFQKIEKGKREFLLPQFISKILSLLTFQHIKVSGIRMREDNSCNRCFWFHHTAFSQINANFLWL